jgi:AcrR family transcriptional regulator
MKKTDLKPANKTSSRTNDPERTMAEILAMATKEFADKGLAGARIDEIAAATRTSKRMIYYYFGSKEGLYVAVLEAAYGRMRQIEANLHLKDLSPEVALRNLIEFTYDHHQGNEDFIRLVMTENVQRGAYLGQSKAIQKVNSSALEAIDDLYTRGVMQGVFKKGLTPLEIHSAISALTFFNVSNQHTFGLIFKGKSASGKAQTLKKSQVVDLITRYVQA